MVVWVALLCWVGALDVYGIEGLKICNLVET